MGMASPGMSRTVQFGVFEVDLRAGELRKQGVKVRLQEQPLQVLSMLLESPGRVVTREELRQRIWPSDTFVDFDQGINNAVKRLREALGDSAETPHYIETLARRGYRFIGAIQTAAPSVHGLAVLPLENLSRDPEQEYFAEGLTEALITTLAKIGELRVVSRTSVMLYKGVRKPLREIARELEVDSIVEGSVLRVGDRIRITAQLIDAPRENHLWAESYERDLRDVLALQSEIAQAIAREVRVKLSPQEQAHLASVRTVDPDAYEAYLKGRYHWNRRNAEGFARANYHFQESVTRDPSYAAGYAGQADCANIAGWWGFVKPAEGCGKAKQLALKALAIDDSLSEAHASLGWSLLHYGYDLLGAENAFVRALSLNPNNVTAREWHAVSLGVMGRFDEALAEIERAVKLDPASAIITTVAAMIAFLARQYERSIEVSRKALELDAHFSLASWIMAMSLAHSGENEAAIRRMEEVVRVTNRLPLHVFTLGSCYAMAGRREDTLRILDELQIVSRERYVSPYWIGVLYACLNQNDDALRWLEMAFQERSAWMVYSKHWKWLDRLHGDPRFEDLLRQIGYPAVKDANRLILRSNG